MDRLCSSLTAGQGEVDTVFTTVMPGVHAVKVGRQCFPDVKLWMSTCYHHHRFASIYNYLIISYLTPCRPSVGGPSPG